MTTYASWLRASLNEVGRSFGFEARGIDSPVSFSDVYGRGLDLFGGGNHTKTGLTVTTDSALEVSAVFGSIRILSDTIATLPLDQMQRRDGVPVPARLRAEWLDFNTGPWNRIQVIGMAMTSLLTDGNAYIATVRNDSGQILWLDVLDPSQVSPKKTAAGDIIFEVKVSTGGTRFVDRMDIKHVPGMMLPGRLEGVSPIGYAKETIGLSRAATEFGGAFFGNGAVPGSTIEVPEQLSPTAAKIIKDSWESAHRGIGNSGRIAVLTEGAKYAKVTLSPEESQFLQTRTFQVSDVARFFGVPLQLLNAEGVQLGSTTAEQNLAFVQHSLRPWIERIEAAFTDLLISEGDLRPAGSYAKLNTNALLRGDMETRYQAWSLAVTQGILTINEVRKEEDLPPVEWGNSPISVQVQGEADGVSAEEAEEARGLVSQLGVPLPGDLPISEVVSTPPEGDES